MRAKEANGIEVTDALLSCPGKGFNTELRIVNSMDTCDCVCFKYKIYKHL